MYIANVNFLWPNSGPIKSILLLVALTASALAAEPVELFNGKNLTGWKAPTGTWTAVLSVGLDQANNRAFLSTPGTGVLLNSNADKTLNIESAGERGDCELHVEFCVPKGSNSGIYLQNRYEVQVFDSFGKAELGEHDCGAIYQRWEPARGKGKEGYEGHTPKVNASKPPGEWQSFDITFRAPRFDASGKKTANAVFVKVLHNGKVIHKNVECTGPTRGAKLASEAPTGPILLQGDHGPVAYRNLKLIPQ
jgi:3-keto-disaccharide hydrolase